jgi:hypothetical protein
MVCDVQELLDTKPCLANLSPLMAEKVETQMLCSLFNHLDSGADFSCDIETLICEAACLPDDSHMLRVLRLQLLCNIGGLV